MNKVERSRHNKNSLDILRIKLGFKEEIEENNLFMGASLAYFFVVLFACLTQAVERYFCIILILTATMIIWYFRDKRKEIRRRYEKEIESLSRHEGT